MIAVLGVLVLDHASSATFIGSSLVGIGIKLKEVRDLVAVLREVCGIKITYLALSPSPSIPTSPLLFQLFPMSPSPVRVSLHFEGYP